MYFFITRVFLNVISSFINTYSTKNIHWNIPNINQTILFVNRDKEENV